MECGGGGERGVRSRLFQGMLAPPHHHHHHTHTHYTTITCVEPVAQSMFKGLANKLTKEMQVNGWNHSHMCNFYISVVIGPRDFTTI